MQFSVQALPYQACGPVIALWEISVHGFLPFCCFRVKSHTVVEGYAEGKCSLYVQGLKEKEEKRKEEDENKREEE